MITTTCLPACTWLAGTFIFFFFLVCLWHGRARLWTCGESGRTNWPRKGKKFLVLFVSSLLLWRIWFILFRVFHPWWSIYETSEVGDGNLNNYLHENTKLVRLCVVLRASVDSRLASLWLDSDSIIVILSLILSSITVFCLWCPSCACIAQIN